MKYHVIGAALLGGLLSVGAASAATCTIKTTGGQTNSYTVEVSSASECMTGNDSNQINESSVFFGLTGWKLADKNDDKSAGSPLTFDLAPVNGTKSGSWSILNPDNYTSVFLTLKAGNSFGAFLLSASEFMSGTWAANKGLSHASIYYQGEPAPAPVPVPAAGFLLAGGLGLLALRRRRKSF